MDKPVRKDTQYRGRKVRADSAIKGHKMVKQDITKEEFLANLGKVCQPISKESAKSDSEKSGT